ncbi:hypothetical protein APICC_00523 [Apis cerana cerana]|uniref:Uncharacterized protein n=1 Tax=Apis cerana cerana TaxID=94128 RepID=A0A2A3E9D1_APICC|nr:hypothetical protein APICC_00523 [Apis cerana cerana]
MATFRSTESPLDHCPIIAIISPQNRLIFPQPPFTLFNSTAAARIHLSPVVPEVDRDAVAQREEWGSKQDRRMQGAQETGPGDRDATSFARRMYRSRITDQRWELGVFRKLYATWFVGSFRTQMLYLDPNCQAQTPGETIVKGFSMRPVKALKLDSLLSAGDVARKEVPRIVVFLTPSLQPLMALLGDSIKLWIRLKLPVIRIIAIYGIDGKFEFIFFVLFNIEIISSEAASNFKNSYFVIRESLTDLVWVKLRKKYQVYLCSSAGATYASTITPFFHCHQKYLVKQPCYLRVNGSVSAKENVLRCALNFAYDKEIKFTFKHSRNQKIGGFTKPQRQHTRIHRRSMIKVTRWKDENYNEIDIFRFQHGLNNVTSRRKLFVALDCLQHEEISLQSLQEYKLVFTMQLVSNLAMS